MNFLNQILLVLTKFNSSEISCGFILIINKRPSLISVITDFKPCPGSWTEINQIANVEVMPKDNKVHMLAIVF